MQTKQWEKLEAEINTLLFGGQGDDGAPTLASRVARLCELLREILELSLPGRGEARQARELLVVALRVLLDIEGSLSSLRDEIVRKIQGGINTDPLVTRATMLLAIEIGSVDPTLERRLVEAISKELLEHPTLGEESPQEEPPNEKE